MQGIGASPWGTYIQFKALSLAQGIEVPERNIKEATLQMAEGTVTAKPKSDWWDKCTPVGEGSTSRQPIDACHLQYEMVGTLTRYHELSKGRDLQPVN